MASNWNDKIRNALRSGVSTLREFAYPAPARRNGSYNVRQALGVPRVGLALGGGFARGIAHVGVLKVLCENRIPVDALSGISAGSIVAAGFGNDATNWTAGLKSPGYSDTSGAGPVFIQQPQSVAVLGTLPASFSDGRLIVRFRRSGLPRHSWLPGPEPRAPASRRAP